MAPLNLTGPENPGCAAGEAVQVYACVLELDVDIPEGPAIKLVVELENMADELEVPGTGLKVAVEEVAVVEVGRTISVVLTDGVTEVAIEEVAVVEVGRTIGVVLTDGVTEVEEEVAVVEVGRTIGVVLTDGAIEVEEEIAVVEVGRTIGVVLTAGVTEVDRGTGLVEVGRTIGVVLTGGVVAVAVEVGGRLVPAMPEHCDD